MKTNELDGRTDLYALGITLYEMLAGGQPFHAHTDEGWMRAHLDEVPSPPSTIRIWRKLPVSMRWS